MCSKIMPPTVFDLYEVPTAMALNHIIYITDGFNFVSPDYADNLYESLKIRASRPNSTVVCGYIPSPPATLKKVLTSSNKSLARRAITSNWRHHLAELILSTTTVRTRCFCSGDEIRRRLKMLCGWFVVESARRWDSKNPIKRGWDIKKKRK